MNRPWRTFARVLALSAGLAGCDSKGSGPPSPAAPSSDSGPRTAGQKHSWGGFPRGAFAKYKLVTRADIAGTITQTAVSITYSLKEVTSSEAQVSMVTEIPQAPPLQEELKFPLKGSDPNAPPSQLGVEELQVAGRALKCGWTELQVPGRNKLTVRVYSNTDIPGFTVKRIITEPSLTKTMELVDYGPR